MNAGSFEFHDPQCGNACYDDIQFNFLLSMLHDQVDYNCIPVCSYGQYNTMYMYDIVLYCPYDGGGGGGGGGNDGDGNYFFGGSSDTHKISPQWRS